MSMNGCMVNEDTSSWQKKSQSPSWYKNRPTGGNWFCSLFLAVVTRRSWNRVWLHYIVKRSLNWSDAQFLWNFWSWAILEWATKGNATNVSVIITLFVFIQNKYVWPKNILGGFLWFSISVYEKQFCCCLNSQLINYLFSLYIVHPVIVMIIDIFTKQSDVLENRSFAQTQAL